MKDLSLDKPKHLIEVGGKPFLHHLLKNVSNAGFREIIMVTGYLSLKMEEFIRRYKKEFPFFSAVNQFELFGEEKYGTLMPLLAVKDIVKDEQFAAVMGDNLYSLDDLRNFQTLGDSYCYVGGYRVADPAKYGTIVAGEDNLLIRIDERNPNPVSNRINSGMYKFTPEIYEAAEKVGLSPRGEYEITDALSLLAKRQKVKVTDLKNFWLDFGKPEDVGKMTLFLKRNSLGK